MKQEKQQELEKAFNQNSPFQNQKNKLLNQYQLVEMSGMLFDVDDNNNSASAPIETTAPSQPTQTMQMPPELQEAQQAVQQAQLQLLNGNQQLQQALFELHQSQEKVKQCQSQVQQAQQQVQITQATANSIINSYR